MVDLDKIIKLYQGILVQEYRSTHQEETANLTDAEVALMNPISKRDITLIKQLEILRLRKEVQELKDEIKRDEEALNDSKTWKEVVSEIKADIRDANIKLGELLKKIANIEKQLEKEETLENDEGFGSR